MTIKELKSLKLGDELQITKSRKYRAWILDNAWSVNTVDGKIVSEDNALDYVLDTMLGMGLETRVEFLSYREDVDDGPGAMIGVFFPGGYEQVRYVGRKDLRHRN